MDFRCGATAYTLPKHLSVMPATALEEATEENYRFKKMYLYSMSINKEKGRPKGDGGESVAFGVNFEKNLCQNSPVPFWRKLAMPYLNTQINYNLFAKKLYFLNKLLDRRKFL